MSEETRKSAVIVNDEDSVMMEITGVRVEGDRLLVRGALMGAWEADMYMDIDSIKAAVGLIDIAEIMDFGMEHILNISVSKLD